MTDPKNEPRKLRPGDVAPVSGIYAVINPDGTRSEVSYHVQAGKTLPPTFLKRQWYELIVRLAKPRRKAG